MTLIIINQRAVPPPKTVRKQRLGVCIRKITPHGNQDCENRFFSKIKRQNWSPEEVTGSDLLPPKMTFLGEGSLKIS